MHKIDKTVGLNGGDPSGGVAPTTTPQDKMAVCCPCGDSYRY